MVALTLLASWAFHPRVGKERIEFSISPSSCNRTKAASSIHSRLANRNESRFPSDPAQGMEKVSPGWTVLLKVTLDAPSFLSSASGMKGKRT